MRNLGNTTAHLVLAALLAGDIALHAQATVLSGLVVGPDGPLAGAEVSLTAFSDKACLDLANKKEPSQAEKDQLAACRKEKIRSIKTQAGGRFQIPDLPPAWYAIVITWTSSSRPPCGGFDLFSDYLVASYLRNDGTVVITAAGSPFELKAGEKIQKDFQCK